MDLFCDSTFVHDGDFIRIEVDMSAKSITFYKNNVRLCHVSGITRPVWPFVSFYSTLGHITISSSAAKGTALHLAAACNAGGGVVSRLLTFGGHELLNVKSSDGKTARELAAAHGHTAVVAEIDRCNGSASLQSPGCSRDHCRRLVKADARPNKISARATNSRIPCQQPARCFS